MSTQFIFERGDKNFGRLLNKIEKKFPVVTAAFLTTLAIKARAEAVSYLRRKLIIRNVRFLESSMRYTKACYNSLIGQQWSAFGTVERDRFSGFFEQETGGQGPEHLRTLQARTGSKARQIAGTARLKPGADFLKPGDLGEKAQDSDDRSTFVFLQMLARMKYNKPFVLTGTQFRSGLYRLKGKQKTRGKNRYKGVKLLQLFKPERRNVRRIKWAQAAVQNMFRHFDAELETRRLWRRYMR
jgi:hypothetical protein